MVVVEGPRFSTRAESQSYSRAGWDVVNMTGQPEAVLARELALCYTAVALVTDLDAGVDAGGRVTAGEVFRVFAANVGRGCATLLAASWPQLPAERDCPCGSALDGLDVRLRAAVTRLQRAAAGSCSRRCGCAGAGCSPAGSRPPRSPRPCRRSRPPRRPRRRC